MNNENILKLLKDIIMWQDRINDERDDSPDKKRYIVERDYAILNAKRYIEKDKDD